MTSAVSWKIVLKKPGSSFQGNRVPGFFNTNQMYNDEFDHLRPKRFKINLDRGL